MQEKKLVKKAGDNEPIKGSETWNDQKVRSYIRYLYQQNERLWQAMQQMQQELNQLNNHAANQTITWRV